MHFAAWTRRGCYEDDSREQYRMIKRKTSPVALRRPSGFGHADNRQYGVPATRSASCSSLCILAHLTVEWIAPTVSGANSRTHGGDAMIYQDGISSGWSCTKFGLPSRTECARTIGLRGSRRIRRSRSWSGLGCWRDWEWMSCRRFVQCSEDVERFGSGLLLLEQEMERQGRGEDVPYETRSTESIQTAGAEEEEGALRLRCVSVAVNLVMMPGSKCPSVSYVVAGCHSPLSTSIFTCWIGNQPYYPTQTIAIRRYLTW